MRPQGCAPVRDGIVRRVPEMSLPTSRRHARNCLGRHQAKERMLSLSRNITVSSVGDFFSAGNDIKDFAAQSAGAFEARAMSVDFLKS